jgi:AcrR family transcriptional regulator
MARPRSDIAPRILAAARGRFLRDGVDGAALRDIAREAGTSLGMITYYFPTKNALFLAVVEDVYARFSAEITAVVRAPGTLESRLTALFLRLARASDAEFDLLRLVVREILVSSARRRLVLDRFLRGHIPAMLEALVAGYASGEIDRRHPLGAVALGALGAGLFPQLLRRAAGEDKLPVPPLPADDLARALAQVVLEGLKPR